jgi:hypothetical protein
VDSQGKDSLVDEVSSTLSAAITDLIDGYKQAQKLLASDLRVVKRLTSMNLTIKKYFNWGLSGSVTRFFLRRRIERIISDISSVCNLYLHYEDNSKDKVSIQTILKELSICPMLVCRHTDLGQIYSV